MPLTSLELTIDQSCEGWLPRAGLEAEALLDAHGRPQMAARLRAEFDRHPELSTLQCFVRLRLLAGSAAPRCPMLPVGTLGPLDGTQASEGVVPRAPCVGRWLGPQGREELETLVAGDWLVSRSRQETAGRYILRGGRLEAPAGADAEAQGGWTLAGAVPWTHVASDGERLATLQVPPDGGYRLRLFDLATGHEFWRRDLGVYEALATRNLRLFFTEGVVVAYNPQSGRIFGLETEGGNLVWVHQAPADPGYPIARLDGNHLYLLACDGLRAVNLRTGRMCWSRPGVSGDQRACWVAEGGLYLRSPGGLCVRYALDTGADTPLTEKLSHPGRAQPGHFGGVAHRGGVTVLMNGDTLLAVGQAPHYPVLWQRPAEQVFNSDKLFIVGEAAIRCYGYALSAYRLEDGEPLWENLGTLYIPSHVWGHSTGLLVTCGNGALALIREGACP